MAGPVIRRAEARDVPAIVAMTQELATLTRQPVPICADTTAAFVGRVMASDDGLALVAGDPAEGFLVASVGVPTCSRARVGIEHGWYCRKAARRAGQALRRAYEDWARERGCMGVYLSLPADAPAGSGFLALARAGYRSTEAVWFRAF